MTRPKKVPTREAETISFADAAQWERWLEANHSARAEGVWIRIARKGSGIPSVTHAEALDVALCFGWIDGTRKGLDSEWFLQKFTPRRPRSVWSKINREKVSTLIDQGRMRAAGHSAIEAAMADGRWDAAYDSQRTIQIPGDLREALEQSPAAAAAFAGLNSSNRYAILFRIHHAKRAETRERRIRQFVEMLERGERIHP